MSKTITITLPEGYEEPTHIVLVTQEATSLGYRAPTFEYGVMVLDHAGEVVEEVGVGGGLNGLMTDAARVVRTGTAVVSP